MYALNAFPRSGSLTVWIIWNKILKSANIILLFVNILGIQNIGVIKNSKYNKFFIINIKSLYLNHSIPKIIVTEIELTNRMSNPYKR